MSMRPFLSYISTIYPDPWSEALCTGKDRMVILGTSWDQAGDCGESWWDIGDGKGWLNFHILDLIVCD